MNFRNCTWLSNTNHCNSIVEQRLSKHQDEEYIIDVDLLKHSEDGDGVHSRNQAAKQQVLQQTDVQIPCSEQTRKESEDTTLIDQVNTYL